jgi:hypothetical protein
MAVGSEADREQGMFQYQLGRTTDSDAMVWGEPYAYQVNREWVRDGDDVNFSVWCVAWHGRSRSRSRYRL